MKILVTVGIFPPDIGGPATFVPEIVNHLQNEHNYEIDILTLSDNQNLNIKKEFSVSKINRNLPLPYRWFSTILKIYRLARDKDLIFVNGLGTETTIANIFLKKKIIRKIVGDPVWERAYNKSKTSYSFDDFQENNNGIFILLQKKIRNFSIKRSDIVVTPSQHLKNFVIDLGYKNKIESINNGVKMPKQSTKIFQNNQLNITILSRLVPHKNIDKVIKAISNLNNPFIKLNIVGEGPEIDRLKSISSKYDYKDNIVFHGKLNREDINRIFLNTDLFIQASNYEGLPHSLLEAMSFGIPVLCTPVGDCKEILENEDRGYMLDLPVSQDNIKSKIAKIINEKDIAVTKGQKGKDFVFEKYNFKNTFNLYKKLFTNLVEVKHK